MAYAVGLLATDGCLSRVGNIIDLTSKDEEQLKNFSRCLGLNLKVGKKLSGAGLPCLRVQFKSILFYNFLVSIGLTPAKSKTLKAIKVPDKYFFDFLRGVFDGDGSFYSYWDPRWRSSFMFYVMFATASPDFASWLRRKLKVLLQITGHISYDDQKGTLQLKYAKAESLRLLRCLYHSTNVTCLSRKRLKIESALGIVGEKL